MNNIEHIRHTIQSVQPPHLLHVLHALQQQFLHISREAMQEVAAQLNLPLSQVESVVGFYAFFRTQPRGIFNLLFSNCTSCGHASTGENLFAQLCQHLNVENDKTRADGQVSVSETACIGMCDHGPSLLINGIPLVGVNSERIRQISDLVNANTPVSEWPSAWFAIHDHIHLSDKLLQANFAPGAALIAAQQRGAEATLAEISASGLRGRGGAGFNTSMKWKFCREAQGEAHYVVCNADEGEPGTFKDRVLLNSYAHHVFEGMSICGLVIGAKQGFLYLRGEYRYLLPKLEAILAERRQLGLLGTQFDIQIVVGAGAYVCGEESALLESLEQKRGIPRIRPPFPVTSGYLGQPTVINNVETFAAAASISLHGGAWFHAAGTDKSAGSKILSVSGDCARPGLYEYAFGTSVQQVLDACGATDVQAVQVGGPSGTLISALELNRVLSFEDLSTGGSIMIYSSQRDVVEVVRNFADFFAHESCGFCTPCRVGTTMLRKELTKIASGHGTQYDVDEIKRVGLLMNRRSHCGLGQTAANPLLHAIQKFPLSFEKKLREQQFLPFFDLDASLAEARLLTQRNDAHAHLAESE